MSMFRKPNVAAAGAALQGERDREVESRIRYFLKDGYNIVRVMPPTLVTPGWGDAPGRTIYLHRVDNDEYTCFARTWNDGHVCDLCAASKTIGAMGMSDMAKDVSARGKFLILAQVRANPGVRGGLREDGLRLIESPMKMRDAIMEFLDPNHPLFVPDWLDPVYGRDLVVSRSGKGQNTSYVVQMSMQVSPASPDIAALERAVQEIGDVDRYYKPSPEHLAKQAAVAAQIVKRAEQATNTMRSPGHPVGVPPVAGQPFAPVPGVYVTPAPAGPSPFAPTPPMTTAPPINQPMQSTVPPTVQPTATAAPPTAPVQPPPTAPVQPPPTAPVQPPPTVQPTVTAAQTVVAPASVPTAVQNPLTALSSGPGGATPPPIDGATGRPVCFGEHAVYSVQSPSRCTVCALRPICKLQPAK